VELITANIDKSEHYNLHCATAPLHGLSIAAQDENITHIPKGRSSLPGTSPFARGPVRHIHTSITDR
jgi:hypothetical protein